MYAYFEPELQDEQRKLMDGKSCSAKLSNWHKLLANFWPQFQKESWKQWSLLCKSKLKKRQFISKRTRKLNPPVPLQGKDMKEQVSEAKRMKSICWRSKSAVRAGIEPWSEFIVLLSEPLLSQSQVVIFMGYFHGFPWKFLLFVALKRLQEALMKANFIYCSSKCGNDPRKLEQAVSKYAWHIQSHF